MRQGEVSPGRHEECYRYAWQDLAGRKDDCRLEEEDQSAQLEMLDRRHNTVMQAMNHLHSLEEFAEVITSEDYHADGHLIVSRGCKDLPGPYTEGVMSFSEVSAR